MRKLIFILSLYIIFLPGLLLCDEEIPTGDPEEVSITLHMKGMKRTLVDCYYFNESLFIPIKDLFDLIMINNVFNPGKGSIEGYFIEKENEYEINFTEKTIILAGTEARIRESDYLNIDGKYFMVPSVIKDVFKIDFKINMNKLSMSVNSENTLPLYRNMKRENIRKLLGKNRKETPAFTFKRERSILNGGFLDYSISSNYKREKTPDYSYNFSLGNEIIGGDLNANINGKLNSHYNTDATWRYVANNRILNQVILSTSNSSQGILSSQFKGATITNAPYGVRNEFSKYVLVDKTIPDSDVELYINNELVDFTTANEFGDFTFDIPLNYGTNIIELKIYNPQGELIEDSRKIQIPFDLLPDKEFQYSISGGIKKDTSFKVINGNVAFGITSWLTNKAGVDYIEDGAHNKPIIYNSLTGRISDNYLFNFIAAPDLYYRLDFSASYVQQQSINFRYTRYKKNEIYNNQGIIDEFNLNSSIPYKLFGVKNGFQVGGSYYKYETGDRKKLDISSEFSIWKINPAFNFAFDEHNSTTGKYLSKYFSAGINIPLIGLQNIPFFNNRYIKAKFTYDLVKKNSALINLSYSQRITKNFRSQFNYSRDFITKADFFSIQFQYDFPFSTINISGNADRIDGTIQGSVGFDGAISRLLSSKRKSIGTSGVSIKMFEDNNNNGKYEDGEVIIDDANIKFDKNVKVERAENGFISAGFLNQYMDYEFNFHRLSGKNPLLVPKYDRIKIETDPNSFKSVEIPFYETEEIYGYVVFNEDGKTIPLPGMKINIKNRESGYTTQIESYSDGSIYYLGLLPGEYFASLDTAQISQMNTTCIPGEISFTIGRDSNDSVTELNFILNSNEIIAENLNNDNSDTISFQENIVYTVQLGAFRYYQNVLKYSKTVKNDLLIEVEIKEFPDGLYKILSGEFHTAEDARQFVYFIKSRGYDAFIRKLE